MHAKLRGMDIHQETDGVRIGRINIIVPGNILMFRCTTVCHEIIYEKHQTVKLTMALPLPPGLTPPEVAFVCEMEMVTVIPRQRLDRLELLGVSSTPQPKHSLP